MRLPWPQLKSKSTKRFGPRFKSTPPRRIQPPEEFLQHLIEKELAKSAEPESSEAAARKIRGIGYIDTGLDI